MSRIHQHSIAVLASVLLLAGPGSLYSQNGPVISDGDRVRLTTDGGSITGVAHFETDGLLFLEVDGGAAAVFVDVRRASRLEVSRGVGIDPSRVLPGLALGAAAGLAVAFPVWIASDGKSGAGYPVLGGLALGLVAGLIPRERWTGSGPPALSGGISTVGGRPALAFRWRP